MARATARREREEAQFSRGTERFLTEKLFRDSGAFSDALLMSGVSQQQFLQDILSLTRSYVEDKSRFEQHVEELAKERGFLYALGCYLVTTNLLPSPRRNALYLSNTQASAIRTVLMRVARRVESGGLTQDNLNRILRSVRATGRITLGTFFAGLEDVATDKLSYTVEQRGQGVRVGVEVFSEEGTALSYFNMTLDQFKRAVSWSLRYLASSEEERRALLRNVPSGLENILKARYPVSSDVGLATAVALFAQAAARSEVAHWAFGSKELSDFSRYVWAFSLNRLVSQQRGLSLLERMWRAAKVGSIPMLLEGAEERREGAAVAGAGEGGRLRMRRGGEEARLEELTRRLTTLTGAPQVREVRTAPPEERRIRAPRTGLAAEIARGARRGEEAVRGVGRRRRGQPRPEDLKQVPEEELRERLQEGQRREQRTPATEEEQRRLDRVRELSRTLRGVRIETEERIINRGRPVEAVVSGRGVRQYASVQMFIPVREEVVGPRRRRVEAVLFNLTLPRSFYNAVMEGRARGGDLAVVRRKVEEALRERRYLQEGQSLSANLAELIRKGRRLE